MNQWCFKAQRYYKSVDCHVAYKWVYPTLNPYSKSVQRYKNVARLRQQALEAAREAGADYLLVSLVASIYCHNIPTSHIFVAQLLISLLFHCV